MRKTQKGITLVALIITIIVLLILSVVTIQTISGDGIIAHAKNARDEYEKEQRREGDMLDYYEAYLEGTVGKWVQDGTTLKKATETGTILEVKIGDKVNYNELSDGVKIHSIESTEIGRPSGNDNIELKTEDLEWRILGTNSDGELELISTNATDGTLAFYGEIGYLNGETVLDTTCNVLYGQGIGAKSARSLNVKDINKLGNYDPTRNDNSGYGSLWRYKYDITAEKIQYSKSTDNGRTWARYIDTEYSSFKQPGEKIIDSSNISQIAELKSTYYSYTVADKVTSRTEDGNSIASLITQGEKNVTTGTYMAQWLASQNIWCNTKCANFSLFFLHSGNVGTDVMWNSYGYASWPAYKIRPVVTLSSDVQLIDTNGDGILEIK